MHLRRDKGADHRSLPDGPKDGSSEALTTNNRKSSSLTAAWEKKRAAKNEKRNEAKAKKKEQKEEKRRKNPNELDSIEFDLEDKLKAGQLVLPVLLTPLKEKDFVASSLKDKINSKDKGNICSTPRPFSFVLRQILTLYVTSIK